MKLKMAERTGYSSGGIAKGLMIYFKTARQQRNDALVRDIRPPRLAIRAEKCGTGSKSRVEEQG